jgi:hypothetical protein
MKSCFRPSYRQEPSVQFCCCASVSSTLYASRGGRSSSACWLACPGPPRPPPPPPPPGAAAAPAGRCGPLTAAGARPVDGPAPAASCGPAGAAASPAPAPPCCLPPPPPPTRPPPPAGRVAGHRKWRRGRGGVREGGRISEASRRQEAAPHPSRLAAVVVASGRAVLRCDWGGAKPAENHVSTRLGETHHAVYSTTNEHHAVHRTTRAVYGFMGGRSGGAPARPGIPPLPVTVTSYWKASGGSDPPIRSLK